MKYFFFLACLVLIPSMLWSQPIISQNSVFSIGDIYTLNPVDTVGINEGDGGPAKTWDFSHLAVFSGEEFETVISIVDPSEGFYSEKFPDANFALKNDTSYVYYKFSGSIVERLGIGFKEGYEFLNNWETSNKYPFTYKDVFEDTFSGNVSMSEDGQTIEMQRGGSIKVTVDAYGTVILPSGVYTDLLRFKVTQTVLDTVDVGIPGLPPVVSRTETEDYFWQNDNYKVPVLHITYVTSIQKIMGHEVKTYSKNILVYGGENHNNEKTLSAPIITSPKPEERITAPFEVEWTEAILQGVKDSDSFSNSEIEYQLEVNSDPSFVQSQLGRVYTTTNTYYTVEDEFDSKTVSIRVKAISSDGYESEWSEGVVAQYGDDEPHLLPTPVQVSPTDGATNIILSPTFVWEGDESTIEIVVYNDDDYMNHKGSNSNQYTFENSLKPNTTYSWAIRQFSDGVNIDSSAWSPVWTFTTAAGNNTIDAPTLISPKNNEENVPYLNLPLIWSASENYIEFEVFDADNIENYYYSKDMPNEGKYIFDELVPNTTYQWRVRQYNDDGEYSDWSETWTFTTDKATSVRDISTFPINNLEVYPNPTSGNVVLNYYVNTPQEFVLYVEDISGKTIFKQSLGMISEGNHTLSLDLSQYARGNYFITIKGNQCSASRNVILD